MKYIVPEYLRIQFDYINNLKKSKMETNIIELVVNGITYVRKDTIPTLNQEFTGDIKIVVLQRGWIYVGRFERNGNDCKLHNASCIRTWGTTKGLQELVNGITSTTKLDKCSPKKQKIYKCSHI